MLSCFLIACLVLVTVETPASAPASAPEFDGSVIGEAIKTNFARLGSYEVEFTRKVETFIEEIASPNGERIRRRIPQPIVDIATACSWKEEPQSLACHYHEERPDKPAMDYKYDGDKEYRRVTPHAYTEERIAPPWPQRDAPNDWYDRRNLRDDRRRMHGMVTPLDLVFPRDGHVPRTLSQSVEIGKRLPFESSIVRFIRSSDEQKDTRFIQFDYEAGLWLRKVKNAPIAELKPDDFEFTKQVLLDRWWLDPDHGYLPVRVDVYHANGEGVIQRSEILQFKSVAPNTWFPTLGTITYFSPVGKWSSTKAMVEHQFDGERAPGRVITIQVTKISPGMSFAKEDFKPLPDEKIHVLATKPSPQQ